MCICPLLSRCVCLLCIAAPALSEWSNVLAPSPITAHTSCNVIARSRFSLNRFKKPKFGPRQVQPLWNVTVLFLSYSTPYRRLNCPDPSYSFHRQVTETVSNPIMASGKSGVTPYLVYLVFITTLGPLQFGYHLVRNENTSIDLGLLVVKSPLTTTTPTRLS